MAKITRYNGNLEAPASAALGTERTIFGTGSQSDDLTDQFNAFLLRGWGNVGPSDQPTLQDFNAMGFTLGQIHAYLHQMGVAEYNAAQEYHTGSITNVAGVLYVSLVDTNVGNSPASSPSQWSPQSQHGMVVLTSTQSWSVPLAMRLGYIKPKVTVVGGGGGSGGCGATDVTQSAASGAGGGGGAAIGILDLTGVASVSVTIGAAGAAGAAGANPGSNGGVSSFGAFYSATGGDGGTGGAASSINAVATGGNGGTGSGGALNISGSDGTTAISIGASVSPISNGLSGSSVLGGGRRAQQSGVVRGSGGGHQVSGNSTAALAGRSGAAGVVIIEW